MRVDRFGGAGLKFHTAHMTTKLAEAADDSAILEPDILPGL
jgi:hypothetical protein